MVLSIFPPAWRTKQPLIKIASQFASKFLLIVLVGSCAYLCGSPNSFSYLLLPPAYSETIGGTDVDALFVQAKSKYAKKDYKGAIADFTEVIRLKPDFADAYAYRGNAK